MASRIEIESFIGATFRSVWALELLCLLRKQEGAPMAHADMVRGLHGSDTIVVQSLYALGAAGLVQVDETGAAAYRPATEALDELASKSIRLYSTSPGAVRRIIATAWSPGITAFADAFRFKKDDEQ